MSEVIARPAKAKSAAPKATPKAPAKPEEGKFTRFTIKAAFGILEVLLQSASKTDESLGGGADSGRLLALAAELAGKAHTDTPELDDAQRLAYDIAALIKAAKLALGEVESAERADLINQAAVQLNWLTECDDAGTSCIDVSAARPVVQAQVSASERKVAATGVSLLAQAIQAINDEDGAAYAADLLKLGQKALQKASEGVVTEECIRDVFFLAAAVCNGALAIEERESPAASHRHELIMSAFDLLNNAGLSYDCELHPCVEAAAAINAGSRQVAPQGRTASAAAARRTENRSEQRARELTNSAICHLEAAKEVLYLLVEGDAGDEVHGLLVLIDILWDKHASTDEAMNIGIPCAGVFADLQRELCVAHAMAALVRTKEEGAMSAVEYLLQDAAQLAEDALHAIPLDIEEVSP